MAGLNPSGRRSRRRSSIRSSSPLAPHNSRGKRRREPPRQPKNAAVDATQPSFISSPRSTEASGPRSRHQSPDLSPQLSLPANSPTDLGQPPNRANSGFFPVPPSVDQQRQQRHRSNVSQPALPSPVNVQYSRNVEGARHSMPPQSSPYLDPVNTYYTTPYPGQMSAPQIRENLNQPTVQSQQQIQGQIQSQQRQPRPSSHGPLPGATPQSQAKSTNRSRRQPSPSPGRTGHQTYAQPPAGGSIRNPRDIRLGPDMRRRPQLSSNPAFGRTRSAPRAGGGIVVPSAPSQASSYPANNGTQLPVHQVVDNFQVERVDAKGSGISHLSQPRTQRLHPRPVARRSDSRKGRQNRRTRTRSSRPTLPPEVSTISLPSSAHAQKKAVSPLVYGVRLLILGVGLGAIAGTLISALDPSIVSGQTGVESNILQTEDSITDIEAKDVDGGGRGSQAGSLFPPSAQQSAPSANIISFNAIPKRSPYTALASQLQTMANTQPELTPGVFALDLDTYNYVDLNGSTTFSAASIIKVPILVAFLQDVEQNKIRLDDILVMEEGDVAGGSGNMRMGTIGDQYSALETAKKMIVISDNTATNMLIRRLGGIDQLNRRFRSWGLTATALRNPLPDLEGTNTTSPAEMTNLMTLISQGKLLESQSRDRMFDIMYQTETATLLPAGIGGNAAIAHKTGDIGAMVGDTGVVDTSSGKRYAITIMMRRPHNDSRAQELIRQMAGVIHRELQTPSTPTVPASVQTRPVDRSLSSPTGENDISTDMDISESPELSEDRASGQ